MTATEHLPAYELFAIRYATRESMRRDNFIGGDPHEAPMPLDYYVWVAKSAERVVVVDSGFTAEISAKRGRTYLRCPVEALSFLGLAAVDITDVVVTHLHYDHVGNFHKFPIATFHLQEPEMHYATGRYMRYAYLAQPFEVEDVVGMVRLNFAGRVAMHNGIVELCPGISLHPTGGHSGGLQFVRVNTARGWVVLASDVSHFYENMERRWPFPVALNVGAMLDGFEKLYAAASNKNCIIPGHDPQVMKRYPPAGSDMEGIVVRLDVEPIA